MPARLQQQLVTSDALLLRRVAVRDNDDIVHLFTEQIGAVSAIARGARRGSKRFSALEPMHTLRVSIDVSPARELGTLKETSLARPRLGLASRLDAMEAAGHALRWVRRAAPARTEEPALWDEIVALLDALDAPGGAPKRLLAASGVRLLAAAGWGLELTRCVRCGKPAPPNARTIVDASAGGVVCRTCGAVGVPLSSAGRAAMLAAMDGAPIDTDPDPIVALVDRALEIHSRGEGT